MKVSLLSEWTDISPLKWPISEEEMRALQNTDPAFQPIISILVHNPEKYRNAFKTKSFYLRSTLEGTLGALRINDTRDISEDGILKPCNSDCIALPTCLRTQLIQYYHDE
jgi:hypothetical protein